MVWDNTVVQGGRYLLLCNNCATHQVRYSAVSVHFCCWFTAQCNTVQCGEKKITFVLFFLLSIKYLLHISSCLSFSHFRELCCTYSTASNYNSDMQVHMMQEMLISVPVVSGKSRKTNKKHLGSHCSLFLLPLIGFIL